MKKPYVLTVYSVVKDNWKVLVEEKPTSKLDWAVAACGNKLILDYMEDVKVHKFAV